MLDGFVITSLGGLVLFEKQFVELRNDPFGQYLTQVLVEKRPLRDGIFDVDSYAVSCLVDSDHQLALLACWQKTLKLAYIPALLYQLNKAFLKGNHVAQSLENGDFDKVQSAFDAEFHTILRRVEERDREERKNRTQRTFEETQKFKSTVEGTKQSDAVAMGRTTVESPPSSKKKSKKNASPSKPKKAGKAKRTWDGQVSQEDLETLDYSGAGDGTDAQVPDHLVDQDALDRMKQGGKKSGNVDVLEMEAEESEDDDTETQQQSGWFGFVKNLSLQKTLTVETLDPVLKAMADHLVNKNVPKEIADHLCKSVSDTLLNKSIGTFDSVSKAVKKAMEDAVRKILTPSTSTDLLRDIMDAKAQNRPFTITFIGVNGVGKSTNLSKTCFWLLQNQLSVLIAACDTFRSGAVEQLKVHVRNLQKLEEGARIELFQRGYGKDAAAIAQEAIQYAKKEAFDVVLIDTAGRMQDNEPLMRALSKLVAVNNPDKIIFVGEALAGNDSVDQLVKFNQALKDFSGLRNPRQIDGMILTKFDTIDDKVGTALSMTHTTGKPVFFVGTGQTYMDLKKMNIKYIVQTLLK